MNFRLLPRISDLRLARKLALLGVIALIAISILTVLQLRATWSEISSINQRVSGLQPSHALNEVIRLVQQHRGLSNVVLGGDTASEAARAAKQSEVDAAARQFDAVAGDAVTGQQLLAGWRGFADEWHRLAAAVADGRMNAEESFKRHTGLIAQGLELQDQFVDHFNLMLASDPASYFLAYAAFNQLPRLTEMLGQVRAVGSLLLASKSATPESRAELAGLAARAAAQVRELDLNLGKIPALDAAAAHTLGAVADDASRQARNTLGLVQTEILGASGLNYAAGDYFRTATETINRSYGLADAVGEHLRTRLEATRSAQITGQSMLLGGLALLLALGIWLGLVVARSTVGAAALARDVADRIAGGDLTGEVSQGGRDEMGRLLGAMRQMQERLVEVVSQVRNNAESVATASLQIAQGNQDLSQRTEEQASSLQQTAATMEQLAATVKQNADNAQQANQWVQTASGVAVKGGAAMEQVVGTMNGISDSSRRIADIIGTIDGIAFQTNILALNAAVEAARAGPQGRGFAVVAGEVRALSQRSADAAKEIKELIGASVERVEQGVALVNDAERTMGEIETSVRSVSGIVGQISAASAEQSDGISQVGDAVSQMDQVTQQNAALVEQSAAAAQSLKDQAAALVQAVSLFRLAHDAEVSTIPDTAADPVWDGKERRGVARAKNVVRLAFRKPARMPDPASTPAPDAPQEGMNATRKRVNS